MRARHRFAEATFVFASLGVHSARAEEGVDARVVPTESTGRRWSSARLQTIYHPEPPASTQWRLGVGLLLDVLPARVAESEMRQIPQLTVSGRLGLVGGLSAVGRLRGNGIGNEFALGFGYAHALGPLWFGVSDLQGVSIGYLGVDDAYSAFVWGFTNTPSVSVGFAWKGTRISLSEDILLSFTQNTTLGDATKASRQGIFLSGFATSLVLEEVLAHGGAVYFGVSVLQTQPDYQAWVAFSDERSRLVYPRFSGGYVF